MKIKRSTKISLLLTLLTLLMPIIAFISTVGNAKATADSSSYVKVYVSPPDYVATVSGDIFTVEVKIANASDLKGFEFKLGFNTTILNALEIIEGSFLESFGTTLPFKLEIDETQGFVWIAIVLLGSNNGANGDGVLATINFETTSTGECAFDLYDTMLGNSEGIGIDHYVTDGYSVDEFVDPPKTPSEEEIHEAIINGIQWLVAQQNPDGSWGMWDQVATTGFAVLKLETHAILEDTDPLNPSYLYYYQVRNGLDYIFSKALTTTIGMQPAGDPDSDGDGIGVCFSSNGTWHRTYETSIAMMAIAASSHPEMVINVPSSIVDGWTYGEVLQDAADYLAFGQNDAGEARGGWGYYDNSADSSDNSVTGYAVLGLAYAEAGFGCTIPSFVRNELNVWIDYIQNDVNGDTDDGGSGYTHPDYWVNILKTGNLLFEMAFVGDTKDTQRVIDAVDYIERHWNDANLDPGWRGDGIAHKQAMYTTMKGFESLGIETIIVGSTVVDWFGEMSSVLLEQQKPNGSWDYDPWGDEILSTEWALLTLQKTVPFPPPEVHDVTVISVAPSEASVKQGDTLSIGVIVENQGTFTETFDVSVYHGGWATPSQWATFVSIGDINEDGYINMDDAYILSQHFGHHPPGDHTPCTRQWQQCINCDLRKDGDINIMDALRLAANMGRDIWTYFSIPGGVIETQTVSNLPPGSSTTLVLTWDTTGFAIGDYTIGAYAYPVPCEFDEFDNNLVDDIVTVFTSLSGLVTDEYTKEPIEGVTISICETGESSITDECGKYSFTIYSAGLYTVEMTVPYGYLTHDEVTKFVAVTESVEVDFTLYQAAWSGAMVPRTIGYWKNWDNHYTLETMETLIVHVRSSSGLFDDLTIDNVKSYLHMGGFTMEQKTQAQLLASWLNVVSAQLGVDVQVDLSSIEGWEQVITIPEGNITTVDELLRQVDNLYLTNADLTEDQWEIVKDILDALNNGQLFIEE